MNKVFDWMVYAIGFVTGRVLYLPICYVAHVLDKKVKGKANDDISY